MRGRQGWILANSGIAVADSSPLNSIEKPVSLKPATSIPVWPVGEMNGPSEMIDTARMIAAGYALPLALAALIFAHLAF